MLVVCVVSGRDKLIIQYLFEFLYVRCEPYMDIFETDINPLILNNIPGMKTIRKIYFILTDIDKNNHNMKKQ